MATPPSEQHGTAVPEGGDVRPGWPEVDRLRTLDDELARVEQQLRDMRARIARAVTGAGTDQDVADGHEAPAHEPSAPRSGAQARSGPVGLAERTVSLVARASLAAQERVDAAAARRRAAAVAGDHGAGPAAAVRQERAPTPRGATAGSRGLILARLRGVLARPGPRLVLRGATGVGLIVLLAVLVLGLGRSGASGADPRTADDPATPAALTPVVDVRPVPEPSDPASGTGTGPTWVRMAPPVSLRVPAIEVDARVVIVGLEPDGAMEIPADVRTVGWYDPFEGLGVAPGEPGTAVIAGHVDSRTQGRGAFWSLRELAPGDLIDVEHADGTSTRWQVESVVRYPKADIPIEDIFTFEGDERLALITCGGEFDRTSRAYLDNYVVTAVPLRTSVGGPAQALPTVP